MGGLLVDDAPRLRLGGRQELLPLPAETLLLFGELRKTGLPFLLQIAGARRRLFRPHAALLGGAQRVLKRSRPLRQIPARLFHDGRRKPQRVQMSSALEEPGAPILRR